MKLLDFHKVYPTEKSCKLSFKEYREEEGIICKKCKNNTHYWKKKRWQWECKKCQYRTTLKSGTIMHHSKMSFQNWFKTITFLTSTKKSFSAKEIQRQLDHNRYEPIWAMAHKIRSVMGLRDTDYQLEGEVEVDEGFFETISITRDVSEKLKRGKGSQKQSKVLVSAESFTVEDSELLQKYSKTKKLGFIKMKVLNSLKKDEILDKVMEQITEGSDIITDGSNSYNDISKHYNHISQVIEKKDIEKILPWVHTTISNAKRLILDMYHGIDDDFLENYLNEFCYKLNRRYFNNLFDRFLKASVCFRWDYLGETCG